jgi:hypothetical protein
MPITEFRINLALLVELWGKDTKDYYEHLLLDVYTKFLPFAKTVIIFTREVKDAIEKRSNKR